MRAGRNIKILFIFIDGLGLGPEDSRINPVNKDNTRFIYKLISSPYTAATQADLGVPGIPQSATGQTTLLTGVNASKVLGRHLNGFPTKTLKHIIFQHSIFKTLVEHGKLAANANAYTVDYYAEHLNKRKRPSATTLATMSAGIPFRGIDDLNAGNAIYQDVTSEILVERGFKTPVITPQKAGKRLARISREYDFTLFEYFLTDVAGHSQNMEEACRVLQVVDRFVESVYDNLDFTNTLLLITSDHGNIEDLSVKTHTINPVPTVLVGAGADGIRGRIKSIEDIVPNVLRLFNIGG